MFRKSILILFLILMVSLLGCSSTSDVVSQPDSIPSTKDLAVHFIDVGQADSIFIELPNGQCMLIDAGKNADGGLVVDYLRQHQVNKIDYLVGTHPHEDHLGGLDDVINNFEIGKLYMPKVTHTTKTFRDVITAAQSKGLKINVAKAGVEILKQPGLLIDILSPLQAEYDELNNYSAVIKLTYGDHRWLFTGDAEELVEQDMLDSNMDLKADILKVGHHGSNTSSTGEFLKQVAPQWAVISAGKDNDYGHPHQEVMERLQQTGIHTLRTDVQGTIIMTSNGTELQVNPAKDEPIVAKEETGRYVGSVNSDKYHLPNCSHVESISPKNIIRFNNLKEAQQANYHPCSNLK
jgi:DNA internalization-related competence protein ComEC/Rec2